MADIRNAKSTKPTSNSKAAVSGPRTQSKPVQATGGDKGSKKTNDFERSDVNRNALKGKQNPENKGRVGVDNEKVSGRGATEKPTGGTATKIVVKSATKHARERVTEAAVDVDAKKNKPRKTSKRERGSRKPGTELTKDERAALKK